MSTIKPWSGRGTTKPGEFRAYCRKGEWIPFDTLTPEQHEAASAEQWPCRWDRKVSANVVGVPCNFETGDRATYLAHMADVHPDQTGPWESNSLDPRQYGNPTKTHRLPISIPVKMWKAPKLLPAGCALATKDIERNLKTCGSCGLVAEVDARPANVLWWAEHERMCVGSAVA